MTTAKEDIYARIRAVGSIESPDIPRDYRRPSVVSREEIISDMVSALEDYTAVVTRVGPDGIADAIAQMLEDVSTVVVPDGLDDAWKDAAARNGRDVRVDLPQLTKDELDKTDAVLTGARVGTADSGTIMLDGEPDQGRRAITLVPDTHVIVLEADDIKATLPEAIAILEKNPGRPTTWISGPSATSDIELVRVDGVHGPRNLRVVIVER